MAEVISVLVACARPDRQVVRRLTMEPGATARQAVLAAGLGQEFPELDAARCPLGIYGRVVADDHQLQNGERVEVYWPLRRDPREARRAAVSLERLRPTGPTSSRSRN